MNFKIGRWTVSVQQSDDHYCTPGSSCEVMIWDEDTGDLWQGEYFTEGVQGWVNPEALRDILTDVMEEWT